MRRTFAVLLLLSLLGGQVRMIGALLGRYQTQQQMQHRIESASLGDETTVRHLTLTRADRQSASFVRIDEREFRYRGNLYDVVREEWRGDVWHVRAVHDRAEEHYLDVLEGTTEAPEGEAVPSDRRPSVLRPIALLPGAWGMLPAPLVGEQAFLLFSFVDLPSSYLEVPHPPPWGQVHLRP
jgi:hypothetical protein